MPNLFKVIFIFLCLWLEAAHCQTTRPVRLTLEGDWQVGHVLINRWRMDKLVYQYNDPQLIGRFLTVSEQHIKSDLPESSTCVQPSFTSDRWILNTLLDQTLLPVYAGHDTAHDFGLKLNGKKSIAFSWVACKTGAFGPSLVGAGIDKAPNFIDRTWIMLLPNGNALTRWYGDTLLVLQRINPKTTIRPSFSCKQARLPTERAICASPCLSSYDASLAKAWAFSVAFCEKEEECLRPMREEQKAWMKERNRCGQETECLSKTMRARLYDLMHPHD